MGPSNKAYNEVKAILGKLDRSIDDARKRRLDTGPRSVAPTPVSPTSITATPSTLLGSASATPPVPTRPTSVFGRAQPLRPSGN
ncbi:MAG: hypothetical protein AMXMBFR58_16470 [Phycisphaerae bacterium]|nr:hypothetical protein [Phycisphaerales bacterium]MCK6476804.1 hypothetical protein [Phycisphaerales bacterium]